MTKMFAVCFWNYAEEPVEGFKIFINPANINVHFEN